MHALFVLSSRGGNILYHRQFSPNFGFPQSVTGAKSPESLASMLYIIYSRSGDVFPAANEQLSIIHSDVIIYFTHSEKYKLIIAVVANPRYSLTILPSSDNTETTSPIAWLSQSLLSAFTDKYSSALLITRTPSSLPGATPRLVSQGKTFSNFSPSITESCSRLLIELSKLCCLTNSLSPWLFISSMAHLKKENAGTICLFFDHEGPVEPHWAAFITEAVVSLCLNLGSTLTVSWFLSEILLPETGHSVSVAFSNDIVFASPVSLNELKDALKSDSLSILRLWAGFCVENGIDLMCDFN
ncbi:hypothetical protein GEMRC1_007226 [Eukaryota sp. GEM-RC1]